MSGFVEQKSTHRGTYVRGPKSLQHARLRGFWASGQALMEYAMVIVIVAVITLAIFVLLGPAILDWYQKILAAF